MILSKRPASALFWRKIANKMSDTYHKSLSDEEKATPLEEYIFLSFFLPILNIHIPPFHRLVDLRLLFMRLPGLLGVTIDKTAYSQLILNPRQFLFDDSDIVELKMIVKVFLFLTHFSLQTKLTLPN